MTEDQAKNLWCPMTGNDPERQANCIGAMCMAWRVEFEEWEELDDQGVMQTYRDEVAGTGRCGMARC